MLKMMSSRPSLASRGEPDAWRPRESGALTTSTSTWRSPASAPMSSADDYSRARAQARAERSRTRQPTSSYAEQAQPADIRQAAALIGARRGLAPEQQSSARSARTWLDDYRNGDSAAPAPRTAQPQPTIEPTRSESSRADAEIARLEQVLEEVISRIQALESRSTAIANRPSPAARPMLSSYPRVANEYDRYAKPPSPPAQTHYVSYHDEDLRSRLEKRANHHAERAGSSPRRLWR